MSAPNLAKLSLNTTAIGRLGDDDTPDDVRRRIEDFLPLDETKCFDMMLDLSMTVVAKATPAKASILKVAIVVEPQVDRAAYDGHISLAFEQVAMMRAIENAVKELDGFVFDKFYDSTVFFELRSDEGFTGDDISVKVHTLQETFLAKYVQANRRPKLNGNLEVVSSTNEVTAYNLTLRVKLQYRFCPAGRTRRGSLGRLAKSMFVGV